MNFCLLGKNIRESRLNKGIGLNKAAKQFNVSPGYLSNLETGKTSTVTLELLNKIQDEYGVFVYEESEELPQIIDYHIMRIKEITLDNTKKSKALEQILEGVIRLIKQ